MIGRVAWPMAGVGDCKRMDRSHKSFVMADGACSAGRVSLYATRRAWRKKR